MFAVDRRCRPVRVPFAGRDFDFGDRQGDDIFQDVGRKDDSDLSSCSSNVCHPLTGLSSLNWGNACIVLAKKPSPPIDSLTPLPSPKYYRRSDGSAGGYCKYSEGSKDGA